MRTVLMGAALAMLVLTCGAANAEDWNDNIRHLNWKCEQGDHQACRQMHLQRECEHGERGACETLHLSRACDDGDRRACDRIRDQSRH